MANATMPEGVKQFFDGMPMKDKHEAMISQLYSPVRRCMSNTSRTSALPRVMKALVFQLLESKTLSKF